jgi:hypothetical protein
MYTISLPIFRTMIGMVNKEQTIFDFKKYRCVTNIIQSILKLTYFKIVAKETLFNEIKFVKYFVAASSH